MTDGIFAALKDALAHNQFLSGGFALMAGGFLLNWARKIPASIKDWIMRRYTTTVLTASNDDAFWWLQAWLASQPFSQRIGALSVSSRAGAGPSLASGPGDGQDRPKILFSPAPGGHWMRYGRCWARIERSQNANAPNEKISSKWAEEAMFLRLYTRDRQVARRLFEEARDFAVPPEDRRAIIYGVQYQDWRQLARTVLRRPDSVILAAGLMEELLGDAEEFLRSERWYAERGLAYHRGYLLHGVPGNGKSSAIMAVAAYLRYNVATLSLGNDQLNDATLRNLFSSLPARTILVIEDVDRDLSATDGEGQVSTHNNKIAFSSILNLLDGIGTPEGRILFMTTNHRERLDPAMIRPGRVDREFELGDATVDQAERIFSRFFPDHEALAISFGGHVGDRGASMAQIQGHLLLYRDDPESAAGTAYRLVEASDHLTVEASMRATAS